MHRNRFETRDKAKLLKLDDLEDGKFYVVVSSNNEDDVGVVVKAYKNANRDELRGIVLYQPKLTAWTYLTTTANYGSNYRFQEAKSGKIEIEW